MFKLKFRPVTQKRILSNRNRTSDRQITVYNYSLPLYQLSYREGISSMGLEPTTLGLLDPRSNQLSYEDAV
eukprot:scaffold16470_cov61-Cyclotella_meneghiniana.AAC.3